MKALYKFYENFGRMGHLEGIFVAEESAVKDAIGKSVSFGEVLGKHSEIDCDLTEKNITFLTNSEAAVAAVENFGLSSGYNPLRYLEDQK